jgi:hypothetical protein
LTTFPNILCIWYPSGGFGHFINGVVTLHGQDFVRPHNSKLEFGADGNSHALKLVAPKYFHDPEKYNFVFDSKKTYSVLIDNGINNESKRFSTIIPQSKILKICYSDYSWPILSRTMIEKAMTTDFDQQVPIDLNVWPDCSQWAMREKYFLFLRDHPLRRAWRHDSDCYNLDVEDLLNYQRLYEKLTNFNNDLDEFESVWTQWYECNKIYINPTLVAHKILQQVTQDTHIDLSSITDVWTQSVVYYFIWLKYNFEVTHNDYSNWFTSTKDIAIMLKKHGVSVDTN